MQKITVIISNIPDELMEIIWRNNKAITESIGRTELVETDQVYIDWERSINKSQMTAQLVKTVMAAAISLYSHQNTKIKRQ